MMRMRLPIACSGASGGEALTTATPVRRASGTRHAVASRSRIAAVGEPCSQPHASPGFTSSRSAALLHLRLVRAAVHDDVVRFERARVRVARGRARAAPCARPRRSCAATRTSLAARGQRGRPRRQTVAVAVVAAEDAEQRQVHVAERAQGERGAVVARVHHQLDLRLGEATHDIRATAGMRSCVSDSSPILTPVLQSRAARSWRTRSS